MPAGPIKNRTAKLADKTAAGGFLSAGQTRVWMVFFADPDGNSLALMRQAPKGHVPELET